MHSPGLAICADLLSHLFLFLWDADHGFVVGADELVTGPVPQCVTLGIPVLREVQSPGLLQYPTLGVHAHRCQLHHLRLIKRYSVAIFLPFGLSLAQMRFTDFYESNIGFVTNYIIAHIAYFCQVLYNKKLLFFETRKKVRK